MREEKIMVQNVWEQSAFENILGVREKQRTYCIRLRRGRYSFWTGWSVVTRWKRVKIQLHLFRWMTDKSNCRSLLARQTSYELKISGHSFIMLSTFSTYCKQESENVPWIKTKRAENYILGIFSSRLYINVCTPSSLYHMSIYVSPSLKDFHYPHVLFAFTSISRSCIVNVRTYWCV